MTLRHTGHRAAGVLLACVLLSTSSTALAQSDGSQPEKADQTDRTDHTDKTATADQLDTVEPSAEQASVNEKAVRAIDAGDYVVAINLLEESAFRQPLNVTWLNLGRAYQLSGRCQKARGAFDRVDGAPAVAQPSPAFVAKKLAEYRAETCTPREQPVVAKQATAEPQSVTPPPVQKSQTRNIWGVAAVSSGVLLAGGSLALHFVAETTRNDALADAEPDAGPLTTDISREEFLEAEAQANTLDTVALSTGLVGGTLIGGGLYLLLTDGAEARPTQVGVQTTPAGTSLTFTTAF
jgi:hypothetical protein